ncbi:major facilitator superfamily domain-containing protein [Ditylenchus destructor]|uniref:Major facilitator superfamily domain-containing protein n=1 Tax=Ditylenchus destructor TaxID=166010 RepID=A0AAD4N2B4_9BILA|nr:major facilitator superfamily domain-containing protein [Ditylenchus destructor]
MSSKVRPIPHNGQVSTQYVATESTTNNAAMLEAGKVVSNTCILKSTSASFRWFPSYRMMTASMLCLCFASVHMMNSNMGMAIVCMVEDSKPPVPLQRNFSLRRNRTRSSPFAEEDRVQQIHPKDGWRLSDYKHHKHKDKVEGAPKVKWSAEDQGWIFGAFNAGLLCMLVTGFMADKVNAKYMIIVSVLLASFANIMIPLTAEISVMYAMGARFMVGLAEALLQPAINSLVTRWFPSSERSYALGLATGGRQIGTLLIVPTAGALCAQTAFFGGWPSIFYVSAMTGLLFVGIYIVTGADKPSKQGCISDGELKFITIANTSDAMGKKRMERKVPWKRILLSAPVWASLISVVCHEFPLMTMIMFLPSYLHDVHHYHSTENGIMSALPNACLWISKIGSSYLNTWMQEKTAMHTSTISKILNGVGSVGLALFLFGVTFLDATRAPLAVVFLCFSMLFTGMHTPGCQAALVAVAPAFSGAITGLTFFFVAICGMINPAMTKWIVVTGSQMEWNIVFYVSTVIALIPVLVFSVWGSAEVQSWARSPSIVSTSMSCPTMSTTASSASLAPKENASEQNCVMQGQRKNSEIATNKEIERYDEREIY